jgi:hypothetical protein
MGAPPVAYSPHYSNDPSAQILAREPDFDIGDCISRGWKLLMNNFGVLAGGTFLIWLVAVVVQFIPLINAFLEGVLYGGLYLLFLKRIRGQEATVGGAFAGFGVPFVQLLLAGFLTTLLTGLGSLFCVLPYIYLKIAWSFSLPLVIDKRLEFWTAMELSRTVVTRVWFKLFVLTVVVFAPFLLFEAYVNIKIWATVYPKWNALVAGGVSDMPKLLSAMTQFMNVLKDLASTTQFIQLQVAAQIILLVNLPIALGALMYAYEALFGPRPAPTA